jgi:hypothetical protein
MCFGGGGGGGLSKLVSTLSPAAVMGPGGPAGTLILGDKAKKLDPVGAAMQKTIGSQDSNTKTLLGDFSSDNAKKKTLLGN